MAVEPMGKSIVDNGVDAGVQEKNFQFSSCGGVSLLIGSQSFDQHGGSSVISFIFAPFRRERKVGAIRCPGAYAAPVPRLLFV